MRESPPGRPGARLRLRLEDDGAVEREVRLARLEALRAALAATDASKGAETAALVRHSYELQLRRAEEELGKRGGTGPRRSRRQLRPRWT